MKYRKHMPPRNPVKLPNAANEYLNDSPANNACDQYACKRTMMFTNRTKRK